MKRKPKPLANVPPVNTLPLSDNSPGSSADDLPVNLEKGILINSTNNFTFQLPAGRRNVLALAVPDNGRVVLFDQDILEAPDPVVVRPFELAFRMFIKRDEVDFGRQGSQEGGQSPGVFIRVIDTFYKDIFKRDPATGF